MIPVPVAAGVAIGISLTIYIGSKLRRPPQSQPNGGYYQPYQPYPYQPYGYAPARSGYYVMADAATGAGTEAICAWMSQAFSCSWASESELGDGGCRRALRGRIVNESRLAAIIDEGDGDRAYIGKKVFESWSQLGWLTGKIPPPGAGGAIDWAAVGAHVLGGIEGLNISGA